MAEFSGTNKKAVGRKSDGFEFLYEICYIVYESLGLAPAEARVGYRSSVYVLVDLLAAVLKVALYHKALYYGAYLA